MTQTPMDSDDFPGVEVAYHAMVDVSEYINETKRDSELLTIIKEIQQSITEWAPNAGIGTSRQKVSLIVKVINIIRDERPYATAGRNSGQRSIRVIIVALYQYL